MPLVSLDKASIFQGKHLVLSDVSFDVQPGEFIYLIGQTGSGKSSLLKTLYGDLELKVGDGKVGSHPLRSLKNKDIPKLRRELGIVFQDFQLLTDRSIEANLDFVLRATGWKEKNKRNKRILEVLSWVGMQHKKHKNPFEISGGEQQRVAIARAVISRPQILLADEPTGNVDGEIAIRLMYLLEELNKIGTTVVVATHNEALLERFSHPRIRIENGALVEERHKTVFDPDAAIT